MLARKRLAITIFVDPHRVRFRPFSIALLSIFNLAAQKIQYRIFKRMAIRKNSYLIGVSDILFNVFASIVRYRIKIIIAILIPRLTMIDSFTAVSYTHLRAHET